MIEISDTARAVLSYSRTAFVRVSSWLDGVLLADDVPVAEDSSAGEQSDAASNVPEMIIFNVPRTDRGVLWDPVGDDHPLAANGQRLSVSLGIGLAGGDVEWLQRGTFLVQETVPDGDVVTVTAVGLLALVNEARLISPFQPTGTLASSLRGLVEPALTVAVDAAVTDRAVPAGVTYDEDRLGAVNELLDAWAASGRIDPAGVLQVRPAALDPTPVLFLTDGIGGTVITARANSTRAGAASVVVARGTAADGTQVQAAVYDTAGPKRWGGPFNPLPVPEFFFSPLMTSVNECAAAAATVLARRRRAAGREFRIQMLPDPTVQLDDVLSLTTDTESGLVCSVERIDQLPYVASGGPMIVTAREL
jgi:uncharacterized protein DUF5047